VEQLEGVTGDRAAATVKADDAFAQFSLGVLYAVGAGLPADYAESAECYPFGSGSGFFTGDELQGLSAWHADHPC
jgi:hypothetical protein